MSDTIRISKTTSENPDFINLIGALDKSLWERYPELKTDYWGNNIIELNPNVVVIYLENNPVACGCFKKYDKDTIEIKRMFVSLEARGMGLAQNILRELELWAHDLGYSFSVLETLYKQKEAIALYQKTGYSIVDNYEPYVGLENSICMRKQI
ncbi:MULTISPECIES: GNAT family N-acetyltransferase [Flavobacterium]|jgi:GNAT superfamily N-acetyltransferase|uniref:GNAT family N-acetyltransferase n=1 Tax=Flavobacterium algoritolerans TaxID=3041254 RepID=A0ABT6VBW3_9FLAO|nr:MULTISPECIES: GNAT family N-acetyltransferase [Flavobacterium]MDI5887522.1 GNAT family N-acetyltransferase [Flavobacterium yafengii]MDI5895689.1 GNAT family N-acetyltransferase [Flavobacterium algoritolerans]PIF60738.1 acetyltransferase (GNAT) family protein [Flavobacterium sp. 11]WKL45115.1 GNAT family N-acetyltransferase [Flavobacterium sp. ZE23DGlu08]